VADERKLKQILVNLLSNAVKFTPASGQLGLDVDVAGDSLRFAVWDTGIGIRGEDLARIFKPFVQLDSKLAREYSGTGLGLSLAHRLAEMHGGTIAVTSDVGSGSRFTVTIPSGRAVAPPAPPSAAPAPSSVAAPARCRILLAEDNDASARIVIDYLKTRGFDVSHVTDGAAAIQAAATWHADLILMDVQMPGVDGLDATRSIRQTPAGRHLPIIALTAMAMTGDRARCLAAGATDYVTKPVSLKQLVELIHRHAGAAA
jgi:CheY-like chemotaxis protein